MTNNTPMNRRRFLAVVAGTSGAVAAAGFGGWRLLGGHGTSKRAVTAFNVDPGVDVVQVEAGFADAATWKNELLTLRPGPPGTGITVRSETTGEDHAVQAPDDFEARCIGVIDDTIVIGGHRLTETSSLEFEAGVDYDTLIAQAGPESERLASQPGRPIGTTHRHTFAEHFPTVVATHNLASWASREFEVGVGTGGSVGAVVGDGSYLAVDHYAFAEIQDSIIEVAVVNAHDAFKGVSSIHRSIPLDHGALRGMSSTTHEEILIVEDRLGTRGYGADGRVIFDIGTDRALLGVTSAGHHTYVSTADMAGQRRLLTYVDGLHIATRLENIGLPIIHRLSKDIAISNPSPMEEIIRRS
ncbi:hypothetical protein [Candidatus Poriferisodalis sp.]|uniref:hypothetical protein n=1 Tax=Candidatus Poriferisodalis sp. TaxID=3101277 RepID=UPI003D1371C0